MYALIKYVHVTAAVLSLSGFFLRGILMLRDSKWPNVRWVNWLTHINDTVLLAAAVSLVMMSGQYPFVVGWVGAKVLGVIAYILLGAMAFRGSTRNMRIAFWLAALMVAGWIVSVAVTRQPAGFLVPLL